MHDEKPLSVGREVVTALIAIAICVVALYMLISVYHAGGQNFGDEATPTARALQSAYNRQKDILLYALALLGTVTGYYLGRVPAERVADRATAEADDAKKEAEAAKAKTKVVASRARTLVASSEKMIPQERTTLGVRSGQAADEPAAAAFREALAALQQELIQ